MRAWLAKYLFSTRLSPHPPAPRGPVTALKAFDATVAIPKPLPLEHDLELVRTHWNLHLRHTPHMTPDLFLQILTERERFFRRERDERHAKLNRLNAAIRPLP